MSQSSSDLTMNQALSNHCTSTGPCSPQGSTACTEPPTLHQKKHSRDRTHHLSILSTVNLLFIAFTFLLFRPSNCNAFMPTTSTSYHNTCYRNLPISAAATLDNSPSSSSYEMSSFAERMKNLITKDAQREKRKKQSKLIGAPKNLLRLTTLEEFKKVVGNEKDKIVVVRWYAPWCKSCKAIAPSFYRLASKLPDVVFVDVPVTPENVDLHQGLRVPSLPYGHIYHPTGKLVEELKMSKKNFPYFARTLKTYIDGECQLKRDEDGELILTQPFRVINDED